MSTLDLKLRAARFLARREHSRIELQRKLAPHAESAEQLETLLDTLERENMLSNTRYATQRAAQRGQRYGNARLKLELRAQGIGEEDLANALAESGEELERARHVWQKKFGVLPADTAERAKQQRFLETRGFSSDTIRTIFSGSDA